MQEYTNSTYYFIKLIVKWKYYFITISIAAIIVSAIFSSAYFIQPRYKSNAILYPSNLTPYSSESESEQMLQLMQASEVKSGVIAKFDLAKHYKIDTSEQSGKSSLIAEYESNIKVHRTEFESIEIEVMDKNPVMARDMVLEIINSVNLKARSLQRKKTKEIIDMHLAQLKLKQKQVDSLSTILQELREKYQLLDYGIQTEEATKSYLRGTSKANEAYGLLKNLQKKGGLYYELARSYDVALDSYNATKLEYENTNKDMFKELTYTNLVVEPAVADKKSYPIRWLIVVSSLASTNIFLFFTLLFLEKRKEII